MFKSEKHVFYKPISVYLYTYMYIMCIYTYMNTYQPFAAVSQLPAALFVSEKSCPWIFWSFEHVYCHCCRFSLIWASPDLFFKKWAIWSNDYASKTRIEILCKKMCCIARDVFPKSDFLSNSWKYGTLARMSTWTTGWQFFFLEAVILVLAVFACWKAWRFLTNCQTTLAVFNYTRVCINRHHKQYMQVDIIFNYMFHFGLPGTCLYLSP